MKTLWMTLCLAVSSAPMVVSGCDKKADPPAAETPAEPKPAEATPEAPKPAPAEPAAEEKPDAPPAEAPLVTKAKKLAVLRDAIRANPEGAAAELEKAGMTEADLEAALFEIAADPAASAAYAGE